MVFYIYTNIIILIFIYLAMFNQKPWQGRTLEVREDRGFVDPNIQNNVNGNGHHSQHSQDHSRRVIDPTNHSHTQNLYGPGGHMIGLGGLFYGVSNTFLIIFL